MTNPRNSTRVGSEVSPLIAMIASHRDDLAIDLKAENLDLDDRALFPILVAIARLSAKADVALQDVAAQSV